MRFNYFIVFLFVVILTSYVSSVQNCYGVAPVINLTYDSNNYSETIMIANNTGSCKIVINPSWKNNISSDLNLNIIFANTQSPEFNLDELIIINKSWHNRQIKLNLTFNVNNPIYIANVHIGDFNIVNEPRRINPNSLDQLSSCSFYGCIITLNSNGQIKEINISDRLINFYHLEIYNLNVTEVPNIIFKLEDSYGRIRTDSASIIHNLNTYLRKYVSGPDVNFPNYVVMGRNGYAGIYRNDTYVQANSDKINYSSDIIPANISVYGMSIGTVYEGYDRGNLYYDARRAYFFSDLNIISWSIGLSNQYQLTPSDLDNYSIALNNVYIQDINFDFSSIGSDLEGIQSMLEFRDRVSLGKGFIFVNSKRFDDTRNYAPSINVANIYGDLSIQGLNVNFSNNGTYNTIGGNLSLSGYSIASNINLRNCPNHSIILSTGSAIIDSNFSCQDNNYSIIINGDNEPIYILNNTFSQGASFYTSIRVGDFTKVNQNQSNVIIAGNKFYESTTTGTPINISCGSIARVYSNGFYNVNNKFIVANNCANNYKPNLVLKVFDDLRPGESTSLDGSNGWCDKSTTLSQNALRFERSVLNGLDPENPVNGNCYGGNYYSELNAFDIPENSDNISELSVFKIGDYNDSSPLADFGSSGSVKLDLNFGDISTFRSNVDRFRASIASSSSANDINILFGKVTYTVPPGRIVGTYNFTHFDGFKDYIYSSNKNASLTDLNFKDFNFIYNYGQYNPVTVRIKSGATSYDYTFDINVKMPILKIRYNKTNGTHMDYNFPSQNGTGIIMASADENLQILSIENVYDQLYIQAGFYKSSSSSSISQDIYNLVGQIFTNNTINIDSNFGTCFSKDNIYTTTNNLDIRNCLDPGVRLPWIFRATVISKLLNYNLKYPLDTINVNNSPSIACMIRNNTNNDINYTLDLTNRSASDINITNYFIQDPIAFNSSYSAVNERIYHPNIGTPRLNGYLSKYSLSFIRPIYVDDSNYSTIAYGNTANTYQISYKSSINVSTITNDFYYKKMFAFPLPPRIKVTLNGQTYDSGVFVDKKYICLPNSQDYNITPSVPSGPVEIKFTDQVSSIPIDINVDYIDFSRRTNYADFNKYFLDVKIQNADNTYSRTLVFNNSTYNKMFGNSNYYETKPECQNVDRNAGIFTKDSKGNNFRINFDQNGFVVLNQSGCLIKTEKIPYGDYYLIVNYGAINSLNSQDYISNNSLYRKQFTIPITIKTAQNTIDFSNDINTNKACYDQVMNYDFNIFSSYNQSSADVNIIFSQDDGQVLYYEQRTVTLNTGQNMISGSFNPKDKGFTSDGVKNAKVIVKINGKEYTKDYTFTLTCIKTVATPDISFMFAVILITIVCFTFVYNNRR